MKSYSWILAALCLVGSPALAQTADSTGGPFTTVPPTFSPSVPGFFGTGLPEAANGGQTFVPAPVTPGYYYYTPYYSPYYSPYWGYSIPMVDSRYAIAAATDHRISLGYGKVPIAGLNSPPLGVVPRMPRRAAAPRRTTPAKAKKTSGSSGAATVTIADVDPQQVTLAGRMEGDMESRPLVEGTVARIGATGVLVRYRREGAEELDRLSHSRVFFLRGERLASAATDPDQLREGMTVLFAQPEAPRQSVAGSREEARVVARARPRKTAASHRATPRRLAK